MLKEENIYVLSLGYIQKAPRNQAAAAA